MTQKKKKKKKPAPAHGAIDMREKINVLALIRALEQHVLGKSKMTATQVSAAMALLRKTLPDIAPPARPAKEETETAGAHEDALSALE